jgi:DNA-binding IclR family transcriptional regulator
MERFMTSLETAMYVLKLLDQRRRVLRVGEVSRELGLQKSTVSRLLRTMSEHELLERERDGQGYVAGPRGLVLADLHLASYTVLERVGVAIDALVGEFQFVGYVGVLSGTDIVILRLTHGQYPLRLVRDVGARVPAWRTAVGRALLARRSDTEALALLEADPNGRPDRSSVRAALEIIRRLGTASIESAVIPGIAAIGAAVFDPIRKEALGFALSFPLSATDEATRQLMAQRLRVEASLIGKRLGDPFWISFEPTAEIIDIHDGSKSARRRSPQRRKASA